MPEYSDSRVAEIGEIVSRLLAKYEGSRWIIDRNYHGPQGETLGTELRQIQERLTEIDEDLKNKN